LTEELLEALRGEILGRATFFFGLSKGKEVDLIARFAWPLGVTLVVFDAGDFKDSLVAPACIRKEMHTKLRLIVYNIGCDVALLLMPRLPCRLSSIKSV